MRKIIHVDMDCFYAAIEIRDNPSLKDRPIAVGGPPEGRSVLCTANYVARKFGVRSAMSSAYAKRLCSALLILPVNMEKYHEVSQQIRDIFFEHTDLVEPLSLDEAYLDVSQSLDCQNSATLIAKEIRQKIFTQCRLTASAGIAPNKFLAKVASDINKPNGQYVIPPGSVSAFVKTLSVKKIFGVGKVMAQKLKKMNIHNCNDLQSISKEDLINLFGKFGQQLFEFCRGIDERPVEPTRIIKSVSIENTFSQDLKTLEACINALPQLFQGLTVRLARKTNKKIHKQFVKIKFYDFSLTTVESKVHYFSFDTYQHLLVIGFNRRQRPVRLLGLGVGFKDEESLQQELFLQIPPRG